MKYLLSFALLFVLVLNVSAQSASADILSEGARLLRTGQFDEALETYRTALTAAENKYADKDYRARLHYNVGVCYLHLDEFDLAADHFKRAILLKTDYSLAYYALGVAKVQAHKLRETASGRASVTK
jgi:tetratricopeptide (TPR) repeat protein